MFMKINQLPYPLWVLVQRGDFPWRPVMLSPGRVVAFSSHGRAGDFLRATGNPVWEVRLVARVTGAALLGDFQRQGASGITLDPGSQGGGTLISFEEVEPV